MRHFVTCFILITFAILFLPRIKLEHIIENENERE